MILESVASVGAAWVWEHFGTELLQNLDDVRKKVWKPVEWKRAAQDYRENVRDLYGTIRVLGSSRPTPLGDIFTDVYILDKPTAYRRFDLTELRQDPKKLDEKERIKGITLVQQDGHERLYVLGQPGAGKTTFLKYLALQAVEGTIDRIPIFVGLKEWVDSGSELMGFIAKQFEICGFPDAMVFIKHILHQGTALVLFDGLDEVPQEADRRTRIIQDLTDFSNQYNKSQCVITCRIAASDYSFTRFVYVEIASFTDEQIESYVCKWFTDADEKRDLFLQELHKEEHRGLREMASTPLLLSMLCLAFDQTMHFPQRRVEVYEEAIEALLKKWDSSRSIRRDTVYEKLTLGRKEQMFARIAAETFQRGEYFLEQDDVEQRIAAFLHRLSPVDRVGEVDTEVVLKAIEAQHGILVQRAHRIYSFAHLSFHEYFTAKYLAANASEKLLRGLFQEHLTDTRWREVFLMLASLLDDADLFFTCFQDAIDALVANDTTLVEMLRWAERKAAGVSSEQHAPAAVRSLYCLFNLTYTNVHFHAFADSCYNTAGYFLSTLDLVRNLNLARALDLASDLTSDTIQLTFSFALDLAPNLARNLASDLTLEPGLKLDGTFFYLNSMTHFLEQLLLEDDVHMNIPSFKSFIQETSAIAHDCNASDLADAMEQLNVPSAGAEQEAWHSLRQTLQSLMQHHRDMGYEWDVSEEQAERFADYFTASTLLLDCLNLASVSDRVAIENRMLLPPARCRD